MKNILAIIILLSLTTNVGKAQSQKNLIGFKGDEKEFITFLEKSIRYSVFAKEHSANGLFLVLIKVGENGQIDTINVLNGKQNIYLSNSIITGISRTRGLWERSKSERTIIVPIIFRLSDMPKYQNGNELIEISPSIGQTMSSAFSAIRCIFLPPVVISSYGTKRI